MRRIPNFRYNTHYTHCTTVTPNPGPVIRIDYDDNNNNDDDYYYLLSYYVTRTLRNLQHIKK